MNFIFLHGSQSRGQEFGEAAKQRGQTVGHCLPGRGETQPWPVWSLFAAIPSWGGVRLGDLQEPQLLLTRGFYQVTAPPLGQLHVHVSAALGVYISVNTDYPTQASVHSRQGWHLGVPFALFQQAAHPVLTALQQRENFSTSFLTKRSNCFPLVMFCLVFYF